MTQPGFRVLVALLALVPVSVGLGGLLFGDAFPGFAATHLNIDADSHFRFLSAIFLAIGIGFWSCALRIGAYQQRFELLCILVFCGGLGRTYAAALAGLPSPGHAVGIVMEIAVVPLLYVWSRRSAPSRPKPDRPARRRGDPGYRSFKPYHQ